MYKTKSDNNAIIIHNEIPLLASIFKIMDEDGLQMEEDEVISYYYNVPDRLHNIVSISSFNQIYKLFYYWKMGL